MILWETHLLIRSEQNSIDRVLTTDSQCINYVPIKKGSMIVKDPIDQTSNMYIATRYYIMVSTE